MEGQANRLTENSIMTHLLYKEAKTISYHMRSNDIEYSIKQMLSESKYSGNILYQLVCRYMSRRGFHTDADFYNSINMPRQIFARIRDVNNTLSKQNILLMIIGLRLNYSEAVEFMQEAGYSFKKSDKRDVIISYIMKNTEYDLDMVNDMLYRFGVKTLIDVQKDKLGKCVGMGQHKLITFSNQG